MALLERDPTDLRDQVYLPSLRLLTPQAGPVGFDTKGGPARGWLPYPIRHQPNDGLCVGFALANLIDIHRMRGANTPTDQAATLADGVSARMLYDIARRIEGRPDTEDGVRSLRSAVKGFYHYGCCPQRLWPDNDDGATPTHEAEVARYKAAQAVTLGAYYRVRPLLNDYHSALLEADGILVSAETHQGWHAGGVRNAQAPEDERGRIPMSGQAASAHAFVIVGYDADGFLVLNSWGRDWGHYRGYPGIALWRYADWARTVMDAWVVRLGVPAPGAFQFSIGGQGISFGAVDIRAGSTACHYLLGHFAHLDDGRHVETGAYASSRRSVALTTGRLRAKRPQERGRVLLTVGGSLFGLKDAFDVETRRRQQVEDIGGIYPYALLWCADLIESATPVLSHIFQTAVNRVGPHSLRLADEIEKVTAGIGRAYWREVRRAAQTAGRHSGLDEADGDAAHLFDHFAATGAPLHLLVDGAGVLVLDEYLRSLAVRRGISRAEISRRQRLRRIFMDAVASVDLIAPPIEAAPFADSFGPLIRHLARKGADRATLWVPAADFEERLSVDHYDGSMLDLVLRSFEGRRDATYIGMSRQRSGIDALSGVGTPLHGLAIRDIRPKEMRRRHDYHEVSLEPGYHAEILARLAGWASTAN